MKTYFSVAVLFCGLCALPVRAQQPVPPPAPGYQPLSDEQLDQLLGPIALYPDPLIAQILPAATLPTQVVLADRYLLNGGDPNQFDQQPWEPSVQALAHYPNVLKWMDDNLVWTTQLGQAFLNQEQEVMDSIQRLRASAQNLGNLASTAQQQVVTDDGSIEILPADPEMLYVPEYAPDAIYYQSDSGELGITFGIGFPIGFWLDGDFDWPHHHLVVWNHDHPRPSDWWRERPGQRAALMNHHTTVWRSEDHRDPGATNSGDRGWDRPPSVRPGPRMANSQKPTPVSPREKPAQRTPPRNVSAPPSPGPAPASRQTASPSRPPASDGAFIGIESSRETKAYSDRGRQSMQAANGSRPASHPAPAANGGGKHDSDSKAKH
jgi:Protein of unknown function (DUF3300)